MENRVQRDLDHIRDLMINKESWPLVEYYNCREKEEMKPADAHYQLVFTSRVYCTGCLDDLNQKLFYGRDDE